MTSITHIPFGLLTAEFACSSFEFEMDGTALALAAIGSLLPDIDHPRSTIGFLFYFTGIPQFLERKLGHRTVTHSWVFLVACLFLFIPLWIGWGLLYYLAAWFGVLSHILIDMANIPGVPLFWPHRARWVFPASEDYRINVGSVPEFILCALLFLVTTAFTPISVMGLRSSFYLLTRDVYSASREARRFFPDYELTAKIRGTWRDTLLPTDYEEKFRVVAVEQSTLYFARGDAVFTTGTSSPSVTLDRILVERARPITRKSSHVEIDHLLVDEIADKIPDSAIVTGLLVTEPLDEDQREENYLAASEEFPTVLIKSRSKDANEIVITYCTAERFRAALFSRGIFVLHGQLTVTTSEHRQGDGSE
ncbi:MAG: metal-dependent hydrolase [Candidatus Hydrogenedentota bacterium]